MRPRQLIDVHTSQMRLVKGINKTPLLNEQIKLIIGKVFLGGTTPSSSIFRLVQVITQPLMALGIVLYREKND
jgi:hypothetical protein